MEHIIISGAELTKLRWGIVRKQDPLNMTQKFLSGATEWGKNTLQMIKSLILILSTQGYTWDMQLGWSDDGQKYGKRERQVIKPGASTEQTLSTPDASLPFPLETETPFLLRTAPPWLPWSPNCKSCQVHHIPWLLWLHSEVGSRQANMLLIPSQGFSFF